jgi:heme/copper-type cytochrome/quinol oxidase subunit 2
MRVINRPFVPVIARWLLLALAIGLALLLASVAAACPTCKDGLAQTDPQGQAMAAGYFYSILFMMAMPFAILGTFGSLAYLSIRRARFTNHPGLAECDPGALTSTATERVEGNAAH